MKNRRVLQFISLVTILVVVFSNASATLLNGPMPFTDVQPSDWFYEDVNKAYSMQLINGKSDTLFKPNDLMSYAEAIKLAACMNQYYETGEVVLKNGSPWYKTYVDYASEHGIPVSFADLNAKISRADYVYIFYYALPASAYTAINSISQIPDVTTNTQHISEIYSFYRAGILTGNTSGQFLPQENIKRSEVSAILTRMMDETARKQFSLPSSDSQIDAPTRNSGDGTNASSNWTGKYYVTRTGKKYHYLNDCGNGNYYEATWEEVQRRGLTPCEKCVH